MMKYNIWRITVATLLTALSITVWLSYISKHTNAAQLQHKLELKQIELDHQIQQLNKTKSKSSEEKKQLQIQLNKVKKQLEAKRKKQAQDKVYAEAIPSQTSVQPTGACSSAKSCIYSHESGNSPTALNSIGCYGIGQDCNGIVYGRCGSNYACQDQYFSEYAVRRYGGWDNAWAFWQRNRWW